MRRVLLKAVGLLSTLVIIVASCLLIGQDQQESSESDAFESETNNIDTMGGYSGLVSHCSLDGGVDEQAAWSEPALQMNMAVAVISAPNQLSRRQVECDPKRTIHSVLQLKLVVEVRFYPFRI